MASSKKRLPVCINVFPTLDYMELVQLNDETRDIQVTAAVPCAFDSSTRQMPDMELFAHSVRDLFVTNRIPFGTPVVLVLPSLLTREFDVPPDMSRDELMMMATSEAERFNVFKNLEAHLDLLKISAGQYVYSAYPKSELEKIQIIFNELKIPLKAIEINYFSILRGLLATGTVAEEAAANTPWSLMVISETAFFIGILQGAQFVTLSETLLSQNIDTNELLQEIKDDYDSFTRHRTFEKLVVINNNTKINTDEVLSLLDINIPVANIDQKPANLCSRGGIEAALPCTLESIGGVFLPEIKELPTLDLRLRSAGTEDIADLRNKAFYVGMGICAIAFVVCLLTWGILALMVSMKTTELSDLAHKSGQAIPSKELGAFSEVQRKLFVKKANAQNIAMNNALIQLVTHVDADMWLDQVVMVNPLTEDASVSRVPVEFRAQGETVATDKITALVQALKSEQKREDITVPTIESKKEGDVSYWTWVIASQMMLDTTKVPDMNATPQATQ